jgi:Protein of unknown function (DUF1566)
MQQQRPRSGIIVGLLSLGLLAGVALTASPASAQTTSGGPYYATPSWDQTLPSATRFIILSNFAGAAVLDRNTGLVWEKSPEAFPHPYQFPLPWNVARFSCIGRNVGGQMGWRLPSIPELASLMDPAVAVPGPMLPPGHPFLNVHSAWYWSATSNAEVPADAWGVVFDRGGVGTVNKTNSTIQVWCVRGGMNAEAY